MVFRLFVGIAVLISSIFLYDHFRVHRGLIKHKIFFITHADEFARIGAQLKLDDTVQEGDYCPYDPWSGDEFLEIVRPPVLDVGEEGVRKAELDLLAKQKRVYEPLLKALGYSDCILFGKDQSSGNFVFSNVGYSPRIDASTQYIYWPEGVSEIVSCRNNPSTLSQSRCSEKLTDNWTLTYDWTSYRWGED